MSLLHIAALSPELPARELKHFKAVVTLIWPYSSSTRQFALLLAEPDLHLRRRKGQVRARFSGSSAKAIATTGVGIGDGVTLSLRGAQFVQNGTVSTPGKSVPWELEYAQTLVVQILREGREIANLHLDDVAATPAPRSPVRQQLIGGPKDALELASPAFLKRSRISDGPIFPGPYDPLADVGAEGHDKKRRRKSYRDWKDWKYSTRTPSPEGDDDEIEELEDKMLSPIRLTELPKTPVSIQSPGKLSSAAQMIQAAEPSDDKASVESLESVEEERSYVEAEVAEEGTVAYPVLPVQTEVDIQDDLPEVALPSGRDDFVRDADYYELYAGPDEHPPLDIQHALSGELEQNMEEAVDIDKRPIHNQLDAISLASSDSDAEAEEDLSLQLSDKHTSNGLGVAGALEGHFPAADSAIHDGSTIIFNTEEDEEKAEAPIESEMQGGDGVPDPVLYPRLELENSMAPPTLPTLNTAMSPYIAPSFFTPAGREPKSPTLQPLDSSTMPLPSPFPGERDNATTSYLDYVTMNEDSNTSTDAVDKENDPLAEADYIMESSFFSSINSSRASHQNPEHESAFTPVRFTFGFDGAGMSRLVQSSSPRGDVEEKAVEDDEPHRADPTFFDIAKDEMMDDLPEQLAEASYRGHAASIMEISVSDPPVGHHALQDDFAMAGHLDTDLMAHSSYSGAHSDPDNVKAQILEGADRPFGEAAQLEHQSLPHSEVSDLRSTQQSAAGTEIIDLGTPSKDSSDEEDEVPNQTQGHDKAKPVHDDAKDHIETQPSHTLEQRMHPRIQKYDSAKTMVEADNYHDFFTVAATPAWTDFINEPPEVEPLSIPQQQALQAQHDVSETSRNGDVSHEPLVQSDLEWQDVHTHDKPFDDGHPDIKMESIEDEPLHNITQPHAEQPQREDSQNLVAVPESDHKPGKLQTVSVPASGPARNTRSKAKETTSPVEEESPILQCTTRSGRSRTTTTPVARATLSPSSVQTRSTQSLSQSASQTSPYILRSKSRVLSPTKSTSVSVLKGHRRKPSGRHSVGSLPDTDETQVKTQESQTQSLQPSQEVGTSQGRYSHESLVQDSEEFVMHSETSLSTPHYDDSIARLHTNLSHPTSSLHVPPDLTHLKHPPVSASESSTKVKMGGVMRRTQPQVVILSSSSPARAEKSPRATPGRRTRSTMSVEAIPFSSQGHVRRTSHRLSMGSELVSEDASQENVPESKRDIEEVAEDVAYPVLPDTGQDDNATPRPARIHKSLPSSPPAAGFAFSINQYSAIDSNQPLTPDATQKTNMGSQTLITDAQEQQQSFPITPQLTQATSENLRSFDTELPQTVTSPSPQIRRMPTTPTRSSPHHAKSTLKSPQSKTLPSDTSSTPHYTTSPSSQVHPVSPTPQAYPISPNTQVEPSPSSPQLPPSVGFSTPLSYYTPLRDLRYFLNRSSLSHSAATNPDILALVTQATSPHTRAPKGPKDWNTSLRVTDLSTFPQSTTVNVFRPFASALPHADAGDIILLRSFGVQSVKGKLSLRSGEESAWCVWRWRKPVWGRKRGRWGEVRAREEVRGPEVERGEGEWGEVGRLREWWKDVVRGKVEEGEGGGEEKGVNGVEGSESGEKGMEGMREERSVRME